MFIVDNLKIKKNYEENHIIQLLRNSLLTF